MHTPISPVVALYVALFTADRHCRTCSQFVTDEIVHGLVGLPDPVTVIPGPAATAQPQSEPHPHLAMVITPS
jgi:hypothetical protein